jgi:hypothetical protein
LISPFLSLPFSISIHNHHNYNTRKSLDKYRKSNGTQSLKCKKCVAEQESKERTLAAAKREATAKAVVNTSDDNDINSLVTCSSCKSELQQSSFNRSQLSKGEGKARCRSCVETSIANEATQIKTKKEEKLASVKEQIRIAKERGDVLAKVKAEAELSALEAEFVTGLKPVKLGRGGRGRGRGGGRGYGGRIGRGGRK